MLIGFINEEKAPEGAFWLFILQGKSYPGVAIS
jgi:hypothetical protein